MAIDARAQDDVDVGARLAADMAPFDVRHLVRFGSAFAGDAGDAPQKPADRAIADNRLAPLASVFGFGAFTLFRRRAGRFLRPREHGASEACGGVVHGRFAHDRRPLQRDRS